MTVPDTAPFEYALSVLLSGIREQQRADARAFVLRELEAIYISAGCKPPAWIGILRSAAT